MPIDTPRNPFHIEDYIDYEFVGFEWKWIGLFQYLKPVYKPVKFHAQEFVADNADLGFRITAMSDKGVITAQLVF